MTRGFLHIIDGVGANHPRIDDTETMNLHKDPSQTRCVQLTLAMGVIDEVKSGLTLYMEQRIYHNRQERTIVHLLNFRDKIKTGATYLFPNCGDEILGHGICDLKIRMVTIVSVYNFLVRTDGSAMTADIDTARDKILRQLRWQLPVLRLQSIRKHAHHSETAYR